ncbi:virion structural protein [Klebsiella phage May]|uniref:LemA family protein n=1 Tax=Klebsiella phage May TaxID=2054272 RepID=A0A2H5BNK9_9CAUD|nr:virion structural protein [Klebsiella phage May]AUG87928.1 hypothetical protein CPT_May_007 [Klebsiella phage May]
MSKRISPALITVGAVVGFIAIIAGFLISTFNGFNTLENNVKKFNKDSENYLSSYTLKVQETAQIPDMYKNGLKEVIKGTFEGRYGADGSKAVVQWIQEQNIQFDSSLYKEIQIVISAGRDEFRISQTKKLDACQLYETRLQQFPGNIVAGMFGFPRLDLEKTCQVVSDSRTQAAFESGVQAPINFKG